MFLKRIVFVVTVVGLLLGATAARAQDSGALLDLLVKKGIITDQEAEDVRADLVKENAATAAGKLKLSTLGHRARAVWGHARALRSAQRQDRSSGHD